MLPASQLAFSVERGRIVPHFLTAKDEVWVRRLLDDIPAFAGRRVADWDRACAHDLIRDAVHLGARPRSAAGMLRVAGRAWRTHVDAPQKPASIRRIVFEQVAGAPTREAGLARAAALLGLATESVEAALFADRSPLRRLIAPAAWPSPRALCETYNLCLVQGLLLRAREVVTHVVSQVRSVVRFAKLKRLLCTYEQTSTGTALRMSGPLSILRSTTKYGHALATFVPAAVATPGWSVDATCVLGGEDATLRISAGDPLASVHALPREVDSMVERRFARDLRALDSGWRLERETAALTFKAANGTERLFFPDFTLLRADDRVMVEIVGFYTPEYLHTKLQALRQISAPVLVCIDEALGVQQGAVSAASVISYRRRLDAAVVVAAAEELVRRGGTAGRPSALGSQSSPPVRGS